MLHRAGRFISILAIITLLSSYVSFIPGLGRGDNKLIPEAQAQTTLPLVQQSNLVYQGAFRLPTGTSDQTSFYDGGNGLGFNPINNSLLATGHPWYQRSAEITIPALVNTTNINSLNRAAFIQPFADATDGKLNQIVSSGSVNVGGHLVYGGKLYVVVTNLLRHCSD